ncbi:possible exported protein [Vibrio ponticus]|nr:possible exported protein [Vibrio ponticus]
MQVLGAFRLDFPTDKSPFLSFYAEADLFNAGETWRYLPTLALGQELTDYLSTAIQAVRSIPPNCFGMASWAIFHIRTIKVCSKRGWD